jgi:hypothetical protein
MNSRFSFLDPLKSLGPLIKVAGWAVLLVLTLGFLSGILIDGLSQGNSFNSPPPLRGMALGLFSKDPAYDYSPDLRELKTMGTNTVLLMLPWYQKDIFSNDILPRFNRKNEMGTLTDNKLNEVIDKAHRLGLKVLMMPYLRFEKREPKEWRGILKPKDLEKWQHRKTAWHTSVWEASWGPWRITWSSGRI